MSMPQILFYYPHLIVCLVGVVISLIYFKRSSTPAVLVLIACILQFVIYLTPLGMFGSLLHAVGFALLLAAAFVNRSTDNVKPSTTRANLSERQHSPRGIASVVISLMGTPPFVFLLLLAVGPSESGGDGEFKGPYPSIEGLLFFAWLLLSPLPLLTGLILGIGELGKADQKRMFPIIGITLSTICLLILILYFSVN